jgi:hypothetical protein
MLSGAGRVFLKLINGQVCMKVKRLKGAALIGLCLLVSGHALGWGKWVVDSRIDLITCQPEGFFARMKENSAPLKFWAVEHTMLNEAVDNIDMREAYAICREEAGASGSAPYKSCVDAYRSSLNGYKRCLGDARRLCRHYGGSC